MTLVCRPTPIVRFMPMSETRLKATHALHDTIRSRGSVFTHDPLSRNPPEHNVVSNVQKNSLYLLFGSDKSGNGSACGQRGFHPLG
jgi:hypothetical protein